MKNFKDHSYYIRTHCAEYVKKVHEYMVEKHWTWYWTGDSAPSEEEIKQNLIELMDDLERSGYKFESTGGFTIIINDEQDRIECYFGEHSSSKEGIVLFSKPVNPIMEFIDYLCKDDVINREYLIRQYNNLKKEKKYIE